MSNAENNAAGSDPNDPLVGQAVADGKYRVVRVIGEGGMGKVYMAEQQLGDRTRPVAIKTLLPELAQDPQIVQRFHREAGTVSLLEHPNTIKFFESGKLADGQHFVAMEFIQGESLAHIIARGALAGQRAEHILQQVCGSLQEAHEHGIVHRDLKPENIVLTQKGQKGDFVKVLDFGIAKRDESEETANAKLTRQGMVLGTPPYMSPEQFTGQPLKPTSDVYSLGIVAYEMLTGHLPFQASTPWEWATKHLTQPPTPFEQQPNGMQINPRHKSAVMHALAKNPSDRPQSCTDFLREFTGDMNAGGDWAVSTSTAQGTGFNSAGGHQPVPTAMAPMPGIPTAPAGSGGVGQAGIAATMAVPSYGNPTPQSFQGMPSGPGFNPVQPSNPGGYTPAPSNAGFQAMQPPSNPGFNPVQPGGYGSMQGGYGSMQGGMPYGSMQGAPPKGSSTGKIVGIAAGALGLVVIGAVVALKSGDNNNNRASTDAGVSIANTANNTVANNTGVNNPTMPVPPTPTVPNNTVQPIPNNGMQPIPTPTPGMEPIPTPQPTPGMQPIPSPQPPPRIDRPSTPSICSRGAQIDDMILNGRCSAAQGLARAMRAAGCRRIPTDSFGSACPAP